jgi:hypothetical protein
MIGPTVMAHTGSTADRGVQWWGAVPTVPAVPAALASRGQDGLAAPVTFPFVPAVPFAPPPPLPYADERWDPARLSATYPAVTAVPPAPEERPDLPDENLSRVVVGYLRTVAAADSPSLALDDTVPGAADEALVAVIERYARDRGLTLLRVHRDDVTDDDARRPGFSACLRHLYLREASAIVIPTWYHLAPNDVLRRALCHNATSAGGTIHVVRPNLNR